MILPTISIFFIYTYIIYIYTHIFVHLIYIIIPIHKTLSQVTAYKHYTHTYNHIHTMRDHLHKETLALTHTHREQTTLVQYLDDDFNVEHSCLYRLWLDSVFFGLFMFVREWNSERAFNVFVCAE